jgi:hypothetical protein
VRQRLPARLKEAVLLRIDPGAILAFDEVAKGKVMGVARERTVLGSRCPPDDAQPGQNVVGDAFWIAKSWKSAAVSTFAMVCRKAVPNGSGSKSTALGKRCMSA